MRKTKGITRLLRAALLPLCMIPAASSLAAISLPGGDVFGNGDFSEVLYGTTGTAYVTPLLFAGTVAETRSFGDSGFWSGFGLSNSYAAGPLGDSLWTIDYSVTNTREDLSFNDLRFMVNLQPDGSSSFNDFASQVWEAKLPGDPDGRQIAVFDFVTPLTTQIIANNGLNDGADACGALACDADLALQWNLASLAPGETWTVRVNLLDDPALLLGGRYLRADSADTANTHLIFGSPQLVPEPQTYAMLLVGLGLLAFLRMRTSA